MAQVDFVLDVSLEVCQVLCNNMSACNFYTFHGENSTTYPDTCFLLTELREPITYCGVGTCVSGSPDCKASLCGYLEEGKLYPNGTVVTETKNIALLMIGECNAPVAVAVGGGGTTQYDNGSGSGYVNWTELVSTLF